MNCARTRQMLDGWLDAELDAATGAEIARHLEQCAQCGALRDTRQQLRARLRDAAPRFTAPTSLRKSVLDAVHAGHAPRRAPPPTPRLFGWWQSAALAMGASAATALVTVMLMRLPSGETAVEAPREEAVTRHVAALAGPAMIEVASSDSHVVKPWFQGKIDFAPLVRDLSAQGYVLEGARRERIGGRPAVALVYRIRKHPINLFIWREAGARDATPSLATVRGFSVGTWAADGLDFAAVSDVEPGEMERFVRAVRLPRQ